MLLISMRCNQVKSNNKKKIESMIASQGEKYLCNFEIFFDKCWPITEDEILYIMKKIWWADVCGCLITGMCIAWIGNFFMYLKF